MVNYGKEIRGEIKSSLKTLYDLLLATKTMFSRLKSC